MKQNTWELKDVVMMAVLGVFFAAVYMAVFEGGLLISVALTPMGLSPFGFELVYGIWFMAATLAAYIIRKPGAALTAEILASAVELLMGNSGGLTVVLTGVIQGLGAELVFAAFRYRKWNFASMSLAELYYLNYYLLAPGMLAAQLLVRFLSAVLFSGIICKLAGDALAKTGVVKSYAVGAAADTGKIYDEED